VTAAPAPFSMQSWIGRCHLSRIVGSCFGLPEYNALDGNVGDVAGLGMGDIQCIQSTTGIAEMMDLSRIGSSLGMGCFEDRQKGDR
jgi:hypothetical protein